MSLIIRYLEQIFVFRERENVELLTLNSVKRWESPQGQQQVQWRWEMKNTRYIYVLTWTDPVNNIIQITRWSYIWPATVVTGDVGVFLTEAPVERHLSKVGKQLNPPAVHHVLTELHHAVQVIEVSGLGVSVTLSVHCHEKKGVTAVSEQGTTWSQVKRINVVDVTYCWWSSWCDAHRRRCRRECSERSPRPCRPSPTLGSSPLRI